MKTFGDVIREARFKKRMKQKDLAKRTGLTAVSIANYESGKSAPSFAIALSLFKILDVDVMEYIKENKEKGENKCHYGDQDKTS